MEKISTGKWPFRFPLRKIGLKHPGFPKLFRGQAARVKLNWGNTIWFIAALFIGRASLMGEITPFAFIFWAHVYRFYPGKKYLTTIAVLAGWAISESGVFPPWFLPAAMTVWLGLDFLCLKIFKRNLVLFFSLPLTILLLRLPLLYLHVFPVYETLIVIMEVCLAALLPPLIQPFFEELNSKVKSRPSPEVIVGAVLILSLLFLGMSGMTLNGIQLINIACPLLVLVWAYLWGALWGTMGGLALGICLSLSNPAMFTFTGALAISGLTAGLLRPYHRLWAALGYFAVLRFLSYYSFEGGYILTNIWEDLIVISAFLLLPFSFWDRLKNLSIFWPFNMEGEEKLRFTMAARIKDFAAVFKELAVTFRPLNQEDEVRSKRDLSPLVDYFCRKVCNSCDFFERCWQRDLYHQYRRVISMLSAVDDDEKSLEKYIPVRLKRYCPRQREIVKAVGNMKEIYRLNCHWQNKIHESCSLVSEQLEGISFVMHDLAQELKLEPGEKGKRINENETLRFMVEIGVAQVAKDGESVSGDSYAVLPLKQGKQAIVLSDGMGSGKDARMASLSTVKLMEHLLGVGFRREVVINTINTLLRLGYPTERFATLDLALLDLHSGEAELYKLGAPPSFFKKGDSIRVIGSSSLPIGILEDITPEKESFKIIDGGIIVMVTDGLTDSRPESEDDWLVNALSEIRHDHPQIIADRLIEEACYRWPRGVQDDLTVLVARLKPFGLH